MVCLRWIFGILVLSLVLLPVAGWAEEHGGQEHAGGSTAAPASPQGQEGEQQGSGAPAPTEVPAPGATETPQPAAPEPPLPPALKPITITFSGELAAVDASATPGGMTVQDRYGVKKEISVPAEAKITQGASAKGLADLKVGDKLTVEYMYDVATGKRTAQSISVGEGTSTSR